MQTCPRLCALPLLLLCTATATAAPAKPAPTPTVPIVGQKTSVGDLLLFLGLHSWKVRIGPAKSVAVSIVQFVRGANGQFQGHPLIGSDFANTVRSQTVDAVIFYQSLPTEDRLQLIVYNNGNPAQSLPKATLQGYSILGDQGGGAGLKVGGEYILMAKYYNRRVFIANKKDMSAYVALRVTASK